MFPRRAFSKRRIGFAEGNTAVNTLAVSLDNFVFKPLRNIPAIQGFLLALSGAKCEGAVVRGMDCEHGADGTLRQTLKSPTARSRIRHNSDAGEFSRIPLQESQFITRRVMSTFYRRLSRYAIKSASCSGERLPTTPFGIIEISCFTRSSMSS